MKVGELVVPGGSRWFPVSLLPGGTWITKTWTNRRSGPPSSWLGMASPSTSSRRDEIPKKGIPMGIRADHQGLGAFSAGAKASEKHCWSPSMISHTYSATEHHLYSLR